MKPTIPTLLVQRSTYEPVTTVYYIIVPKHRVLRSQKNLKTFSYHAMEPKCKKLISFVRKKSNISRNNHVEHNQIIRYYLEIRITVNKII